MPFGLARFRISEGPLYLKNCSISAFSDLLMDYCLKKWAISWVNLEIRTSLYKWWSVSHNY